MWWRDTPGSSEQLDKFNASLMRCLSKPAFLEAFYERFTAASPEVAAAFVNTNFEHQTRMLRDSLEHASVYALTRSAESADLAFLTKAHARSGHAIHPRLYFVWLRALLATARDHDPYFNDSIEAAWVDALMPTIERMMQAY